MYLKSVNWPGPPFFKGQENETIGYLIRIVHKNQLLLLTENIEILHPYND